MHELRRRSRQRTHKVVNPHPGMANQHIRVVKIFASNPHWKPVNKGGKTFSVKCILIEDEEVVRAKLRELIADAGGLEIIDEAAGFHEGLVALKNHPDTELLLLDVELPDGTGFDLLEALENPPKVIFITNYEAYALRAFEVNALDYIQKPVTASRLKRALQRIQSNQTTQHSETGLRPDDLIVLTQNNQKVFTPVSDITVITSDDNYTQVIRADGKEFLMKKTMTAWEQQLPAEQFKRLDRKHIINLASIDRLEKNSMLRFKNNAKPLPLGRTARERLRDLTYRV